MTHPVGTMRDVHGRFESMHAAQQHAHHHAHERVERAYNPDGDQTPPATTESEQK